MPTRLAMLALILGLLALTAAAGSAGTAGSAGSQSAKIATPVRDLSQQVWALQCLHDFDLTQAQLKALRAAVATGATAADAEADPKVSPKYLAALRAIRDALVKNQDDDQIDDLQDDLDTIADDDDIDVDDSVTVTDAARAAVPQVVAMLSASQVAAYLTAFEDDAPDPKATLMDAAATAQGAGQEDFDDTLADTCEEIGILVAGIDPAKYQPVAAQVKDWLQHCRGMSKAQFTAAHADLEKSASALLGTADAFTILRHWVERDVSELLSNPQLTAAIDARLQHASVDRKDQSDSEE